MAGRGAEGRIWGVLALVIAAVVIAGLWGGDDSPDGSRRIPESKVPDFALIERTGEPVTRRDLDGRPWVADFIFTSCAGVCPILSSRMARLQKEVAERGIDARLVSFTVDPSRDTPQVLRSYAQRYGADADRWWFLTGERSELYELIARGFRLSVAERSPEEADDGELITHSDRLVLVDAQARIRGYYHGTDAESVERLLSDLESLH